MKKILALLSILCCSQFVFSQLNTELVAHFPYEDKTSDVWGYTAPDGTEYALVGLHEGVSIVSLADPENPEEVAYFEGGTSKWRDLRTFGHYAYIVADQPGSNEGLWILDLSGLPDNVAFNQVFYTFPNDTMGLDTVYTCHNIWVDNQGFAYLTGCDINEGGAIFLDLNTDPFNPTFAGLGHDVYSHDNYARNDTLFTSEIYEGQFAIYEVSDKDNPVLIGSQETPFRFTHNVWLSDDGKTLFTTDEKANAPTTAFDISDPTDIQLLDEFRPAATLGTDVIPHNVHVRDEFLVISHYTDGCVIVDANKPDNLVEVGNFDTNVDFTSGFHGAWGVYPFFPSGMIAITDIENGLYIINPTYVRASYLEGLVTDAITGIGIFGADVSIQASTPTVEQTDLIGEYRTGLATAGTFNVTFKAVGYFDQVVLATIASGEITELNVQMVPLPTHAISGKVVDGDTQAGIENAAVFIESEDFAYEVLTDASGNFNFPSVVQSAYQVYVGKWGYQNLTVGNQPIKQDDDLQFELFAGYEDNFNNDLGWVVSGDATSGIWERGVPFGTNWLTTIYNPFFDSPNDLGNRCYVTGNSETESLFADQVDNGTTYLSSPTMELASRYTSPVLTYDTYFYTVGSNNLPNDTLYILVSNGADTVEIARYDRSNRIQDWEASPYFILENHLAITDEMQLIFEIGDKAETPNVIEAGLDNFKIQEFDPTNNGEVAANALRIFTYPNPSSSSFLLEMSNSESHEGLDFQVFNVFGQMLESHQLRGSQPYFRFGNDFVPGTYFVFLKKDNKVAGYAKVVKL